MIQLIRRDYNLCRAYCRSLALANTVDAPARDEYEGGASRLYEIKPSCFESSIETLAL